MTLTVAVFLIVLSLICLSFAFLDATQLLQLINNSRFSESSITLVGLSLAVCTLHVIVNYVYTRRFRLNLFQIALLPSCIIPLLFITLEYLGIFWALIDPEFSIELVNQRYLDETVLLVCSSATAILTGILISKFSILSKANQGIFPKKFYRRGLDGVILLLKKSKYLITLTILAVLIAPFQMALRVDLLFQGGRGTVTIDNPLLQALLPLAGILSTMLTMLAGFGYTITSKSILFVAVFADVLPRLIGLSRAFALPIVLFIFAATLLGKKFPSWLYVVTPVLSIIAGTAALTARGVSTGGVLGLASGFREFQASSSDGIQVFFESNMNIGILSQAFAFRDPSRNPLDGLFAWILTISPVPSFLGLTGDIPDVAALLRLAGTGVPMPLLGDLYFQMGWVGLFVLFLMGWWMGRLESNIILHTRFYGTAYWPHVLLWLSLVYALVLSFHSASRASSRVLIYSLALIWTLESIVSLSIKRRSLKVEEHV